MNHKKNSSHHRESEVTQEQETDQFTQPSSVADECSENPTEAPSEASEASSKTSDLQALEAERNSLKDQLLRCMAEFDNYRKRTLKEKADLIKSGGERVLVDLLPIVDDFERALKHQEEQPDDALGEGVRLIYNKLMEFLNKQGVKQMEVLEVVFDDNFHEAVAMVPAPSPDLKGKVLDCVKQGYTLHDKVIRYAHVVVGQ